MNANVVRGERGPAQPFHAAKKEADGSYTILASFGSKWAAEQSPLGDHIIQTREEASGFATLVGAIVGGVIGTSAVGPTAGFIVAQIGAGILGGGGAFLGFGAGWIMGVLITAWIGKKIAAAAGRKDVQYVFDKVRFNVPNNPYENLPTYYDPKDLIASIFRY